MKTGKREVKIKKLKLAKTWLIFGLMYLSILMSLAAGIVSWIYLDFNFKEQEKQILAAKEIKFDKEIDENDLGEIEEFFGQRKSRYDNSGNIIVREIFD
ncbi:MAG: hypothetical protein ABIC19_00200 [Patescibacteria group bacterium]|nr:hypothetical protein [Patescibacteria group bacterium]